MICNLCFYGAVRTLDKTSDSIKKYVINPLSKQYTIKIFSHYNVLNIRSPMCFYLLRSDGKKHGWCKDDLKNRYKTDEKK